METRFRQFSPPSTGPRSQPVRHKRKPSLAIGAEQGDRIFFVDERGYPITVVTMADYHQFIRNQAATAMAARNLESLPSLRATDTYIAGLFVG